MQGIAHMLFISLSGKTFERNPDFLQSMPRSILKVVKEDARGCERLSVTFDGAVTLISS